MFWTLLIEGKCVDLSTIKKNSLYFAKLNDFSLTTNKLSAFLFIRNK